MLHRKSPNNLYGVTAFSLFIPIQTKLTSPEVAKDFDFKGTLESTKMKDLKTWKEMMLLPNEVSKRIAILGHKKVS